MDHNLVADLHQSRISGFEALILGLKKEGVEFPYSPAHIEEIACIFREDDNSAELNVEQNLLWLAELSDDNEILPGWNREDPTRYQKERPLVCMERVLEHYNLTRIAEDAESFNRSILGDGTFVYPPKDVFEGSEIQGLLRSKLANQGLTLGELPKGPGLRLNHQRLERAVDALFRALTSAGYLRERASQMRSSIHDVSHAIYGTRADFFVTNDRKLHGKIAAVYDYLEAETKVFLREEFISLCSNG